MAAKLFSFQYAEEEQTFKVVLLNVFAGQPIQIDVTLETMKLDNDVFISLQNLQTYAQTIADSYDYKAENTDIQAKIDELDAQKADLQALIK